eukprot:3763235-Pyramimonas_sp.AAC.1
MQDPSCCQPSDQKANTREVLIRARGHTTLPSVAIWTSPAAIAPLLSSSPPSAASAQIGDASPHASAPLTASSVLSGVGSRSSPSSPSCVSRPSHPRQALRRHLARLRACTSTMYLYTALLVTKRYEAPARHAAAPVPCTPPLPCSRHHDPVSFQPPRLVPEPTTPREHTRAHTHLDLRA